MKISELKNSKLIYLVFCIPFILAFLSWHFFPIFANWLTSITFGYEAPIVATNWVWLTTTSFLYAWYTFLTIGIAGAWAIAAAIAKTKHEKTKQSYYPMISFIVPAHNEEKNISRCIDSLFKSGEKYGGLCEILVVDDGSKDYTYEIAWASVEMNRRKCPRIRGKIIKHCSNLGKVEAIKSGVNSALGGVIAVVDADSWWLPQTLQQLVDYMLSNGKKAVTGYVHPSDGIFELNPYTVLQQLEYSQGVGVNRCAQSLGDNVLVVSGAIGLYDAEILREILNGKKILSVTEDLEITLEMHRRNAKVGYAPVAVSSTMAPESLKTLWSQRLRWFMGWLDNTSIIHRDLLSRKSWLTLFLWYCYVFEFGGAFIDIAALAVSPFLLIFAPDQLFFVLNLLIFLPYGLLIGVMIQAIALKFAYNKHDYKALLFYTPFYPILRLINIFARLTSSIRFALGDHGAWQNK
jgi:cellulose synthase/poly-beta-1,6-N-acetylglucosamine synthase-like glycosyltransferase